VFYRGGPRAIGLSSRVGEISPRCPVPPGPRTSYCSRLPATLSFRHTAAAQVQHARKILRTRKQSAARERPIYFLKHTSIRVRQKVTEITHRTHAPTTQHKPRTEKANINTSCLMQTGRNRRPETPEGIMRNAYVYRMYIDLRKPRARGAHSRRGTTRMRRGRLPPNKTGSNFPRNFPPQSGGAHDRQIL